MVIENALGVAGGTRGVEERERIPLVEGTLELEGRIALPEPALIVDRAESLSALSAGTLKLLRQLAVQNLESLGVNDSKAFIDQEMVRTFSTLATSISAGEDREEKLRAAIRRAIDEVSD